jgi:excisionase family DNA binding protein
LRGACNSGSQRYCSEHCAEAAKAQRKKRQQDFLKAVQPVIDIASQEYLTFSKAAILMGCSRQYVYKLVNEGKLPASRISSRMAFVRKADIEKMLAGNPYHRVLPGTPTNKPCKTFSSFYLELSIILLTFANRCDTKTINKPLNTSDYENKTIFPCSTSAYYKPEVMGGNQGQRLLR